MRIYNIAGMVGIPDPFYCHGSGSYLFVIMLVFDYILLNMPCSGSKIFWYGSGDPYHELTDPNTGPDPALFVSDFQDAKFFSFLQVLFEGTFTSFFKDKK